MMCQRIGRPPISTIGLGLMSVSSAIREPIPPASMATFIVATPDAKLLRRSEHSPSCASPADKYPSASDNSVGRYSATRTPFVPAFEFDVLARVAAVAASSALQDPPDFRPETARLFDRAEPAPASIPAVRQQSAYLWPAILK